MCICMCVCVIRYDIIKPRALICENYLCVYICETYTCMYIFVCRYMYVCVCACNLAKNREAKSLCKDVSMYVCVCV